MARFSDAGEPRSRHTAALRVIIVRDTFASTLASRPLERFVVAVIQPP
jgi:hypothetical protein